LQQRLVMSHIPVKDENKFLLRMSRHKYDKDQQSAKKGTITYKNINNPHLAIWATQLRGYTHRTNAEQVNIVKIQTD